MRPRNKTVGAVRYVDDMKTRTLFAALAVSVLALPLAACSSESPSTPAEGAAVNVVQSAEIAQSDPEPDGPSQAELQAYFEAVNSDDPKVIQDAVELAAPDSNAQAYAVYRTAVAQAGRDAGHAGEKNIVKSTDGGFEACTEFASDDNECAEYTNIQHEGDKIADFDAGGEPLAGRLSLGNGETVPLGALGDATLLAAYRSIAGHMIVVFEMTSSSEGFFPLATYIAPDSRQSDSTLMDGPIDLNPGALANYAFYFEGAEFGGEILIEAIDSIGQSSGPVGFQTE